LFYNSFEFLSLKKKIVSLLSQTFFGKLFRLNKYLFVIVAAFFALSVFANLIRLEISPFFVWNLYAEKYFPKKEYTIYEVRHNGKLLNFAHTWLEARQIILSDPLANYLSVTIDHHPDYWSEYLENHWAAKHPGFKLVIAPLINKPTEYRNFPGWYKKYIGSIKNEDIREIYVARKKLVFAKDGNVEEIASDTMLVIR
jgi:hypothetical protein